MALLTIRPTRLDCAIADFAEEHATPRGEGALQFLTYAADEQFLFAVSLGFWLLSRGMSPRRRRAARYLTLNVAASAVLPHILKARWWTRNAPIGASTAAVTACRSPGTRTMLFRQGMPCI